MNRQLETYYDGGIGDNSANRMLTVEVRLFNSLACYGGDGGCHRTMELPAGTIDPPEPPIECARRELAEETGYRAGKLEPLLSFYSTPGICTEHMHAFVASELAAGETAFDPGERIENWPMEYEDALRAIGDGRIVDAKTIVTLLYYDLYVRAAR